VTEAQLSIANGAVRCGSCLHIFSAEDHWINNPAPTGNKTEEPRPTAASNEASTSSTEHHSESFNSSTEQDALDSIFDDDLFADHDLDLLASEVLNQNQAECNLEPTTEQAEYDPTDQAASNQGLAENEEQPSDTFNNTLFSEDELLADTSTQSIINVEDDLHALTQGNDDINSEVGFSDSFLELDQFEDSPSVTPKEFDEISEDSILEEDEWAKKILEDETEDDYSPFTSDPQPQDQFEDIIDTPEDERPTRDSQLLEVPSDLNNTSSHSIATDDFILSPEPMMAGDRIGEETAALLANIEPAPVEISTASKRSRWIKRAWLASIAVSFILFFAQYLIFNFDRLSRDDNYRPLITSTCLLLGCTVPSLDDIGQIRSSNLMVRSHPSIDHALVVDAIIVNRADFKQQFPIMELQFTDIAGNIIAGRRFTPNEYLAGELTGSNIMPIKQPIHISLEIVDPGQQAVNYQLNFYPQQDS
jgi:hypothetical protein